MSTTSHGFDLTAPMQRRSKPLRLGSSPIVSLGSDRRLIDFSETRFRVHSLKLQKALRPLAKEIASELGVSLSSLEDLAAESPETLKKGVYCAFDFLDLKNKKEKGFRTTKWIPLAVFVNGERAFSLHASYDGSGASLVGITMRRENQDEYTPCTTAKSALKVGRSYVKTYVMKP